MRTYAVHLKPLSSLISWPASDTLFGALCWAIRHVYGREELKKVLAEFVEGDKQNGPPPFVLSSAFPCWHEEGRCIRFYPKPLMPELNSDAIQQLAIHQAGEVSSDRKSPAFKRQMVFICGRVKELKKIAYVSEAIFRGIVEGTIGPKDLYGRLKTKGIMENDIEQMGDSLISLAEREKIDPDQKMPCLWTKTDVLHTQVDRLSGSAAEGLLYYNDEILFTRPGGGLWFLVKTDNIDFLKPLFRYLEDTGIGGERTSGKGHFMIICDDKPYQLPKAKEPDSFIILSRWFPKDKERIVCEGAAAAWTLLNQRPRREVMHAAQGKFISNTLLRMFAEGSVFPLREEKECYGRIEPVEYTGTAPAHEKIYRNGLALPVMARIGD